MHCRAAPNFSGGSVEISWLRRIALIAPALAGAIATLALGGIHWPGILASAVILVLGGWMSHLGVVWARAAAQAECARDTVIQQKRRQDDVSAYLHSLEAVGTEVAPAWSQNVELARTQIEGGVTELTSRFSGIVARLRDAAS